MMGAITTPIRMGRRIIMMAKAIRRTSVEKDGMGWDGGSENLVVEAVICDSVGKRASQLDCFCDGTLVG